MNFIFSNMVFEFIEFNLMTLLSSLNLFVARDSTVFEFSWFYVGEISYSRLRRFYEVFEDLVLFSSRFVS